MGVVAASLIFGLFQCLHHLDACQARYHRCSCDDGGDDVANQFPRRRHVAWRNHIIGGPQIGRSGDERHMELIVLLFL